MSPVKFYFIESFDFYQYDMTQYNRLNVKLSNSQLNKLTSAIKKSETEVVLRLLSDMVGDSDDKINFPHELLLTNRQVSNLCKSFANKPSTDIKLSKTQISKMIPSGGLLGRLLGPLLKTGLPLIRNVIKPLAKNILIPLELTAAAAYAGIHKKILRSGTTTLIISNDERKGIIKIVKSLEESGLLIKAASKTIQNEAKEQKGGFICILLCTLGVSLLGNILSGKEINRAEEGVIRTGYGNKRKDHKN